MDDLTEFYDTEWDDYEKPCPECGAPVIVGIMLDQGCYEGLCYRCQHGHEWMFRPWEWIPPYWTEEDADPEI